MCKRRWWLTGLFTVLTVIAWSGFICSEESKEQIIKSIETKAALIATYRADLSMSMDVMGEKMVTQGSIFFKKPDKSYIENDIVMGTMKMKQIIVSDGKTVWTYQPTMKMVTKIDLGKVMAVTDDKSNGQMSGDISEPFRGYNEESISYVRTDQILGEKVYIFQGVPGSSPMQKQAFMPAKIETWVSAVDGLIRKLIMFSDEGKEMMVQSYTNIETNIEVEDSRFDFVVPDGIQVMDLTEGTLNMMKEMRGEKK